MKMRTILESELAITNHVIETLPSFDELERRLRGRHTEDEESIQKRLEIARNELSAVTEYKYRVTNNSVPEAVLFLNEIYQKEID